MKNLHRHSDGVYRDHPELTATRIRVTRLDVDGRPLGGPGEVFECRGFIRVGLDVPPEPPDPATILDPPLVLSGFEPYTEGLPALEAAQPSAEPAPPDTP